VTGGCGLLAPDQLHKLGYKLALYPVMLLSSSIAAMQATLKGPRLLQGGLVRALQRNDRFACQHTGETPTQIETIARERNPALMGKRVNGEAVC
jgi:hypothetical protein